MNRDDIIRMAAEAIPAVSESGQVAFSTRDIVFSRPGAMLRLTHGGHHHGYVIGQHWLSVAYDRICAGEDERVVLADYGYVPDKTP